MSTTFISIDVATKSLAIGVYRTMPIDHSRVCEPNYLCSIVEPIAMNVYDINNGAKVKDTSITAKSLSLKRTLHDLDQSIQPMIEGHDIKVLIEYQMNANHLSNAILNMIVYHYVDRYPVEIIKPALKNTIALGPNLALSDFLASATSNYKANKEHSRQNMLYLLDTIGRRDMIIGIKKCNQDDIADTLCQMIAYMLRH